MPTQAAGSKHDVERAASTSGGSMFTIARQVLTNDIVDVNEINNDTNDNLKKSSMIEYECNTITHFDDEFNSLFGKSIENNLLEVPEDYTEYRMEEQYNKLNLVVVKERHDEDDSNNTRRKKSIPNDWYNSWLSTSSNGLDFVLHNMDNNDNNNGDVADNKTKDEIDDQLNKSFKKNVYDEYKSIEKESEAMYTYYTQFQK